jgi:capsular polysaccharide biosynthesis protein
MDQPVELQLSHWLRVVARRMRLMVVIVLACAAVGMLSGFLSGTTYTATTTVLLQQSLSEQGNQPSSNLQVLSQLAASDLVQHEARLLVGDKPALSVASSSDGQVLTFKATAETAGAAQQAADAYAAAFRQLSSDAAARQLASAQQSLQDQIRQLDKSLASSSLSAGERDVLNARRANYAAALNKLLVQAQLLSAGQALVVSPAKAPTSADSRQVGLHTGFGLLLGLVLATAVAGLVDRREDRVRSERDLLQRLSDTYGRDLSLVPLAAPGRKHDAKHVEETLPAASGSVTADAFAIVRASLTTAATGPTRVIMVAEPARAVGTTSMSLNLAAAFSRAGRRTVVASLDFRNDSDRAAMERVLTPPESRSRKIVRLPRARAEEGATDDGAASEVTRLFPLTFRTVPNDDNLAVVTSGQLKGSEDLVAGRPVLV